MTERGQVHVEDPGEPSTGLPRISIAPGEIELLAALGTNRVVIEIGTGLGVSTRALNRFALETYTVDIDPWVQENIWPGLSQWNVHCRTTVPDLGADLIFIDGDHRPEAFLKDLEWAREHLLPGGLIVCHDAHELATTIADQAGSWWVLPTRYGIALHVPE